MLCTKWLTSLRTSLYRSGTPSPVDPRVLICTHWQTGTGNLDSSVSGSLKIALRYRVSVVSFMLQNIKAFENLLQRTGSDRRPCISHVEFTDSYLIKV
jgi:hypothetical protein